MTENPDFSIIIPNFNGDNFLLECLDSLQKTISKIKTNFEIILVDNNSQDNSAEVFKKFVKTKNIDHTLIRNRQNLGFAGAVNQGICCAKYNWVILLNNDLTFSPDWFENILSNFAKFNDEKIAALFGTVLNKTGDKIESQGFEFFHNGKAININNNQPYLKSKILDQKPKFIQGAPAAVIAYNKKIISKVGLFDQDLFAYLEDVDLCFRLNRFGYKTLYVPQAISFHIGGATSNRMSNLRSRMTLRNWILIIIKNYSLKDFLQYFFPIICERFHNFSYFYKQTFSCFGILSILILPLQTIQTALEIIYLLPKMLYRHRKLLFKVTPR